jgi:hypothetical protein
MKFKGWVKVTAAALAVWAVVLVLVVTYPRWMPIKKTLVVHVNGESSVLIGRVEVERDRLVFWLPDRVEDAVDEQGARVRVPMPAERITVMLSDVRYYRVVKYEQ